jgi:Domain of unknown function (DUF4926)
MAFSLFDVVTLLQDLTEEGLQAGMRGTVVDVYTVPVTAYEVEFCDALGRTIAQLALFPEQLRRVVGAQS